MVFIEEAVFNGAEACRQGRPRSACPYPERRRQIAWERGWDMQRCFIKRGVQLDSGAQR